MGIDTLEINEADGGKKKKRNSFRGQSTADGGGDFDVFAPHHSLRSGAGQASWHKLLKSSRKKKSPTHPK